MTTAESRKRLKQLMSAMEEIHQMPGGANLTDSLRRVLMLMDLCPWLSEDEAATVAEYVQPKEQPR